MTGKRFQYNVNKNTIEQDGEFVAYVNCVDGFRIANKLTALAKENKQLKKENQGIQDKVMRLLDYVELKQCVTRTEIKKWWNGDV